MSASKTGFRDVKQEIVRRVRERVWPAGATIPGEVELAEDFGCARATVNRALRELAEEGLLDRRRRAGTRVRAAPARQARFEIPLVRVEIESAGAVYRYALAERQVGRAPDWLAARLGLERRAQVLHVRCMHFADNAPYQYEERWINVAAVPNVLEADLERVGPNEWLVGEVPFTDAEMSCFAAPADDEVAEFLDIQPGEPVFVAERTTWLDGAPVTHARLSFARGYRMTTRY